MGGVVGLWGDRLFERVEMRDRSVEEGWLGKG